MGLLTERAAKTLIFYFMELNPTLMQWLEYYMTENPIPRVRRISGAAHATRRLPPHITRWWRPAAACINAAVTAHVCSCRLLPGLVAHLPVLPAAYLRRRAAGTT